jgi:glyoxylase-like metal-dependent hydrolase (beta-lactamase superfamily II)
MTIIRITYGETALPESMVFFGGDKDKKVPIILSFFLVQTGGKNILVDAGCEDLPGFDLTKFQSATAALKDQGIDPKDITDVVITHVHHDHAQCVRDFPNARVWVQEQEYARAPHYFENNPHIATFPEETTVADGIRVVKIGGHTTGSCVVECEKDGKIYVLCGDECYTRYNLEHKVPTASSKYPENSKKFIEKYTREPYICLLCHEA